MCLSVFRFSEVLYFILHMLDKPESEPLFVHPQEHFSHNHFIRINFSINNHNLMVITAVSGDPTGVKRVSGSLRFWQDGSRL